MRKYGTEPCMPSDSATETICPMLKEYSTNPYCENGSTVDRKTGAATTEAFAAP